jgi:major outer membrane protein
MQVRKRSSLSNSRLALGLLAAALAGALASPALAADKDYKGWYGSIDLALTQPNSLDQHFANEVDTSLTNTNRLVIDNDSDFTWRADVGYTFGRGFGSLQVSYWSFDNEDKQNGSTNGYLFPSIFGYGYPILGMYLYNSPITFQATGKVKARTFDLDYVRPIQVGEKFTVKWLTGFRTARFEEDQSITAVDSLAAVYSQSRHQEATGNGLRVGVSGVFGLTKHFSIEAGMAASFMQAKTDGDAIEIFNSGTTETKKASDDHVTGEIRDYDFRAVWNYGRVDYFLGYDASQWEGLVTDPLPASGCCGPASGVGGRDRNSVSFNSFHGGITYRFGKPR